MLKLPPVCNHSESSITLVELERFAQDWLFEGEYQQHTTRTLGEKKNVVDKLLWFLRHREFKACGVSELRHY